jgi:hypothetical protein
MTLSTLPLKVGLGLITIFDGEVFIYCGGDDCTTVVVFGIMGLGFGT